MNADRSLPPGGSTRLLHGELTGRLIKLFFELHGELGGGFLESVYAQSYALLLRDASIAFERELSLVVRFRGEAVGVCKPDFVVERAVVIECKCAARIDSSHRAQLLNYLKASDLEVGLLLNFGPSAQFARLISTNPGPAGRRSPSGVPGS